MLAIQNNPITNKNMKTLIFVFLLFVSCNQVERISEKDVMKTFNDFILNSDNDISKFKDQTTKDFLIYEVGKKWSSDEFVEFVKSLGKFKSKRNYSNIVINTDINSAHISLEHTAEIQLEKPTPDGKTVFSYEWLESGYLIK
ncbi:MAG: hypothetical protein O3A55_07690, partial [Bacteroidetes bacterium]|nr:hypothetical protein [Bacteroidota bacterium]